MKKTTIAKLTCPQCRAPYTIKAYQETDEHLLSGFLQCRPCCLSVPVYDGFALFTEVSLEDGSSTPDSLQQDAKKWFGNAQNYQDFVHARAARETYDIYAAFRPFNESSRAILPLVDILREHLKPGDLIVDTWMRTGWSGEWLAGLFPEQQIVSIWEGDRGLGYKGFRHWLPTEKRAPNLDILFHHPDNPLPFADNTFAMVHGLDSLHRYAHQHFVPETLRVCRKDGILIFPHIHLSNSEPEPFFERGCFQYHGKKYHSFYKNLLKDDPREAYLMPEVELFEAEEQWTLQDDHNSEHYNALLLIAPSKDQGRTLRSHHHPLPEMDDFVLLNPFVETDLHTGTVSVNREGMSGQVGHMLDRHPVYEDRLERATSQKLTGQEAKVLFHARTPIRVRHLAQEIAAEPSQVQQILQDLSRRELLTYAAISEAAANLQTNYAFPTQTLKTPAPTTFQQLWNQAGNLYQDRAVFLLGEDRTTFDFEEVESLTNASLAWFQDLGLGKGDIIVFQTHPHPEMFCLIWAAWLAGIVVAPLDLDMPEASVAKILQDTKAKLFFVDPNRPKLDLPHSIRCVHLDDMSGELDIDEAAETLGEFLELHFETDPTPVHVSPENAAALLYTSGSTGVPKGVLLSQESLCRSGNILHTSYGWNTDDTFLGMGTLHTMSGLRNPSTGAFGAGATIAIPNKNQLRLPLAALELCSEEAITILTTVPAFLHRALPLWGRMRIHSFSLRQILSTGALLPETLRQETQATLHVQVLNYYGLTETGGICVLVPPNTTPATGSVGSPVETITQILDEDGQPLPPGEIGELRVYNRNLMLGYFQNKALTSASVRNGWYYTGDLALLTEDHQLILQGRRDERIKNKYGEILYPSEISEALHALPQVAEAYSLPWTDDAQETAIASFVVLHKTSTSSVSDLQNALLSSLGQRKLPKHLQILETLPRHSNGKVNRQILTTQHLQAQ